MITRNKVLIIIFLTVALASVSYVLYLGRKKGTSYGYKNVQSFDKSLIVSNDIVVTGKSDGFYPSEIAIKKGTRVVWVNESGRPFWPASNLHPTHELYPEFDPKEPVPDGQAWSFTFKKIGDWPYHDHLRPSRRGIIKVTD